MLTFVHADAKWRTRARESEEVDVAALTGGTGFQDDYGILILVSWTTDVGRLFPRANVSVFRRFGADLKYSWR